MNVALINGPSPDGSLFTREGRCTQKASIWSVQWPPITLAYLAAVAERHGHQPVLIDCPVTGISRLRLVQKLVVLKPELCILAVATPSFTCDMETASAIKHALPATRIVLLGVHATVLDRQILAGQPAVDGILRHEPEGTLEEWLTRWPATTSISGLTCRHGGEVRRNPDRPYLDDLDSLPFPAWHRADLSRYRLPFRRERFLSLIPLRGCPYRCSFCTAGEYYGHRPRLRSVASVIAEIAWLRQRFGIRDLFLWAETFSIDRPFVMDLCAAMRTATPDIRWTCNSRLDTVDADMLRAMRAAGCWMISFGIESTDPEILAATGKKPRFLDPHATLRQARQAGLMTVGHFILGLPGETPATMRQTAADARKLPLDFAQFYALAPFRGSPLFEQLEKEGKSGALDNERISQDQASVSLPGLTLAQLDRFRRRTIRRFYLRPRLLLRLIRFAGWGVFRQGGRELRRRLGRR